MGGAVRCGECGPEGALTPDAREKGPRESWQVTPTARYAPTTQTLYRRSGELCEPNGLLPGRSRLLAADSFVRPKCCEPGDDLGKQRIHRLQDGGQAFVTVCTQGFRFLLADIDTRDRRAQASASSTPSSLGVPNAAACKSSDVRARVWSLDFSFEDAEILARRG